jgi:hypothetical protein
METLRKITANVVLALQVLILFILIFESSIEVPPVLQAFGRMHPLLLHLPIGLIFVVTILIFAGKFLEVNSKVISLLLYLLAFTCSATALMGILLSQEGGYIREDLQWHKWFGIALSFITWGLILRQEDKFLKIAVVCCCILVTFTGDLGATLTHGESFIAEPLLFEDPKPRVITDSSTVFSAVVEPILESKCYGCHNKQKSKGQLVLTSLESIRKGGKNGKIWVPGSAAHSLLVKRISLPTDAREHMPPKDKAQLTPDEISFLRLWIDGGADTGALFSQLAAGDTLQALSQIIIPRYYEEPADRQLYQFEFASREKIGELSTPNRSVFQIARNEPALAADFYLRDSYNKKYLEELSQVSRQIVSLNLSNMPVDDDELRIIAQFPNLEKLILNNTKITGPGLKSLTPLKKLRTISLAGTSVDAASLAVLQKLVALKDVYLWNTRLGQQDLKRLRDQAPGIQWDPGFIPDEKEKLKLNPPLLSNEGQVLAADQNVLLKHNLPGTEIRYTLDGTDPDSLNGKVYDRAITIADFTIVKTRAFKDGWASSDQAEYILYKKGRSPAASTLLTSPEPKFEGEGIATVTDGLKGMPDFYKDPSWIGFRNNPLVAIFSFSPDVTISNITLSYGRNAWAMCMPPEYVEVWGGPDAGHLKLLRKVTPAQPQEWVSNRIEGVEIPIPPSNFTCYKVVAKPLAKLPAFRNEKKEKGWLMVDEIFFN